MQIVLATRNKDKKKEIQHILKGIKVQILSLDAFPHAPLIKEDGKTLEENAIKKAKTIAKATGLFALADDTGLCVDYLNGAPGVFSARYAKEGCSYLDNNIKLLRMLKGVPLAQRKASFCCVIALADPEGHVAVVEGKIRGRIAQAMQGDNGFGYDPVFYITSLKKTFAELTISQKNQISHRAKALRKARRLICRLVSA